MTETKPNTPVRGKWPGVAAIDYNGERYCIDCAKDVLDGESLNYQTENDSWESVENADGKEIVEKLISGEIYTLSCGGVLLKNSESPIIHCGMGESCKNRIEGKDHDYQHNIAIGGRLSLTELTY